MCIGAPGAQVGNLWALYYKTGTAYRIPILGVEPPIHKTHVVITGDVPSEPSIYIGKTKDKVYIQSAGGLVGIDAPLPYNPRGGIKLWRSR